MKHWPLSIRRLIHWALAALLLSLLLLLLASTPVIAVLGLKLLNQLQYQVNPVAAQVHTAGALVETDLDTVLPLAQEERDPMSSTRMHVNGMIDALTLPRQVPSQLHYVALPNASASIGAQTWYMAQAIVVLGGGLGRDANKQIIPNIYTQLRLQQAALQYQATHLPLLLSGVEAPWMQRWLLHKNIPTTWLEKRSLNTCENARFTALLLQKQGGAAAIELVTDAYHMPRSRRLFALNGIETVPVIAPLPVEPMVWWPDRRNLTHTRRAIHELIAVARDVWVGETNCREVP